MKGNKGKMLAGTEHGISKANIVIGAAKDLDFSLQIKRERTMAGPGRGFHIFGVIETIYFEPDAGCKMPLWKAKKVGRRIYWPEGGPAIARSIPENDLLIVSRLPLRRDLAALPDVPDPEHPVKNPYLVDQYGKSHLPDGQKEKQAPKYTQLLEEIASCKFRNFLICHPVAQIVVVTMGREPTWGSLGSYKMPISSLSSFDGTKMALLVDPYTGEMFFKGGRYDIGDQMNLNALRAESTQERNDHEEVQTILQGRA
jgi:hypothetical protein